MIKINLATRKQSGLAGAARTMKIPLGDLNLSQLKDFPIKKGILPIAVGIAAYYLSNNYEDNQIKELDDILGKLNNDTTRLQVQLSRLGSYEDVKKSLEEDENAIRNKLDTIQKLVTDRSTPPSLVASISSALPKEVWLSDFKIEMPDVDFKGYSLGFNQVSDFMKNLNENAYVTDVNLKNSERTKDEAGFDIVSFEIMAKRR